MRGLFRGNQDGWLAIGLFPGRIDVAQVVRSAGARPRLLRLESYARGDDDAKALAALRKRASLGGGRCTTVLASGDYQLVQVEAPSVPDAELVSAVRWSVKENLDFPVESATVDVVRIPAGQSSGRAPSLFVVAANNASLAPRIQAFDAARLDLHVIDIPEMAQRNVAALVEETNRGLAMLTFDASGGLLTFTHGGELYLARRIEITSEQLATTDIDRRAAYFERIGLELQRSLDNFERMYSSISVSKVVLGPGTIADELAAFLRDYVYVAVEILDLPKVIDCEGVPEIRQPDLQAERFLLIGAALREAGSGGA